SQPLQTSRLRRMFFEGFTAMDIAVPLVSFDVDAQAGKVKAFMADQDFDRVGIRVDGLVRGYVRREELAEGTCEEYLHPFTPADDLVADTASLIDVVKSLSINQQCFVTTLNEVVAIVALEDLEKPPMRMFLFGLITLSEMLLTNLIRRRYPDDSWQSLLSEQRLAKAQNLQQDRRRRGQKPDLVDCLQYGDKGHILSYDEEVRQAIGWKTRKEARRAIKEMETLRNNLAHVQAIIPTGWERIVVTCSHLEDNLSNLAGRLNEMSPR
ncbi:MAG: bifunctional (p)ppGpp synthetase/guanosine-3',5'-bis(diphosphate) 3'-pyrophosphohydrolase, partial [Cyanobacteria bacterium P01_H01_bin.152]